jgi:hypothetical protein
MSNNFVTKEDVNERLQKQNQEVETARQLQLIYAQFPQIRPCDATANMIADIVVRFTSVWEPVTLARFQEAIRENPDALKSLVIEPVKEQNDRLINEIVALLRSPTGDGRGGKFSDTSLNAEIGKMKFWTREQLAARLQEVKAKQALQKQTSTQIRADLAEARKDTRPFPGWPTLPASIVPRGQIQAVQCDAAYLRSLHPEDLRRMTRLYSVDQINFRLSQG